MARRRAPTAADFVVLAVLVAAVPGSSLLVGGRAPGDGLLLRCAGRPDRVVDARRDGEYTLVGRRGETVVRVRDRQAWIATAPCRNRLCVRMGRIDGAGRALVCLPNGVLVRFVDDAGPAGVDTITR